MRSRTPSVVFKSDDGDVVLEVEILDAEVRELGQSHTAVDEQAHDRGVAPVGKIAALARAQQLADLLLAEHGGGASGTAGGFMFTIGLVLISPSSPASHLKNCWRLLYRVCAVDALKRAS